MSRARPGEGNNLFGGRQKIFKIPAGGSGKGSSMGGRALYDDAVSQSAFQKLREREREEQEHELQERSQQEDDGAERSSLPTRSTSPPLAGYNRNRETSSTTSSGPSLTWSSTAATSVTSQGASSVNGYSSPSTPSALNQPSSHGLDRSLTKTKRLYEAGLDLHLHNQQSSAINRLESLSRLQITETGQASPTLSSPVNALFDGTHTAISSSQHPALQSASPPLSSTTPKRLDFGAKPLNTESQKQSLVSPPLSPPMSDGEDHPVLPIQPKDRGKATALGAFSKPVQPYDENKYAQRQLQMKESRSTSPFRKGSPPRSIVTGQQPFLRARAESSSTYSSGRSRSPSVKHEYLLHKQVAPQASIDEAPNAESQIKSGTFLSSPNGSTLSSIGDGGLDESKPWGQPATSRRIMNGNYSMVYPSAERPPESEHPANRRHSPQIFVDYTNEVTHRDILPNVEKTLVTKDSPADSPTLGPGTGLSGMVRQHLRTDSNTSSVYRTPSPGTPSKFPENLSDKNTSLPRGHTQQLNNWDQHQHNQPIGTIHTESESFGNVRRRPPIPPPFAASRSSEDVMEAGGVTQKALREKDGTQNHTRDVSLETRKERDEFANELATRRMRVQANLRSRVESVSPVPGADWSRDVYPTKTSPIGMQKSKPGRGSIITKPADGQLKAMKMLGIGHTTISSSSPNSDRSAEEQWWKEEEEMLRGVKPSNNASLQTRQFRQARRDAQRDRERQVLARHQSRGSQESGDRNRQVQDYVDYSQQQQPNKMHDRRRPSRESKDSASNRSGSIPSRDRSGSETSTGSKNRNDGYRDELSKTMAGGHGSPAQGSYQDSPRTGRFPVVNGVGLPHPSNGPWPAVNGAGRSRSSSKSPPSVPFDNQLQPLQTSVGPDIGVSPRPSPITPYSINSTPALAHPSPVGSGVNMTTMQGFQNYDRIPSRRKRSINKSDISEPTLVSKTSHITTVDLPRGTPPQSSMPSSPPPLPPMHPRRQQTRAQTLYGALTSRSNDSTSPQPISPQSQPGNISTFSADESEKKPRQKLRKISSEGGNLNSRARQALAALPSPAMPSTVSRVDLPMQSGEGTMF
jgi:hypothetical protein